MNLFAETTVIVWPEDNTAVSASECERSFLLPQLLGSLAGETCAMTDSFNHREYLPSSPNGWVYRGLKALFA